LSSPFLLWKFTMARIKGERQNGKVRLSERHEEKCTI
jgi:hypothetical protein